MKGLLNLLRIILALALILISLWALYLPPLFPSSTYALVNADTYVITSPFASTVGDILVKEKQAVKAGSVLITLRRDQEIMLGERKDWQLQIEQLQKRLGAIVETRNAQQNGLLHDQRDRFKSLSADYERAQKSLETLNDEHQVKIKNRDNLEKLFKQGIITLAQWQQTQLEVTRSEKELQATQTQISRIRSALSDNARNLTQDTAQAQEMRSYGLEETTLRAEISALQDKIRDSSQNIEEGKSYKLINPGDGLVWKTLVVTGQSVTKGQVLSEIASSKGAFIEAYLGRQFLDSIGIGDNVSVYLNNTKTFYVGKVKEILSQEDFSNGRAVSAIHPGGNSLKVIVEINGNEIGLDKIGQLAKVIITSANPSLPERVLVWLGLTLRGNI